MTKHIYFEGSDEDTAETCEVGDDLLPGVTAECGEDATWFVEDSADGTRWLLCTFHKDLVKAAGIAS